MTIKAIETVHNGYRFRSRLEARWAVFFDTLGVHYEYEKEGFDLGEAGWYLPDFWIPSLDCWIEVKPDKPDEGETRKAGMLAAQSRKWVNVFAGSPWPSEYSVVSFHHNYPPIELERYARQSLQEQFGYIYLRITGDSSYWEELDKEAGERFGIKYFARHSKLPYWQGEKVVCFHEKCSSLSFGYISKIDTIQGQCQHCGALVENSQQITLSRCFSCGIYGYGDDNDELIGNDSLEQAYSAARQARF